jgi:coenzyme F420 biosynthesis associated uncharacterized protein
VIDFASVTRVAQLVAGTPRHEGPPHDDLAALAVDARARVEAYAQLRPPGELPAPEWLSRSEWIEANVRTMGPLLELVGERVGGSIRGPRRLLAGGLLSVQVGALTGFMAQRVLGQYDIPLLDAQGPARLLLVAPNLGEAAVRLGASGSDLLHWVTLHEVTHAVQFTGVPWLRPHLAGLLREVLESIEVRIDAKRALRVPSSSEVRELLELLRGGDLVTLAIGRDRRALLDRVQATMAVIEGHAEHVMDEVGAQVLPTQAALRAAMERRRLTRSTPMRILERLLGLELKLRQYRDGKRFCDHVVARGGIETLNRLWSGAEALPTLTELHDPAAWLERTATPLLAG